MFPSVRAFGRRVIQGSPGPSRPLRLLPERTRRFANHQETSNHESTSEDTDNSINVGDQDQNTGNINNQFTGGSAGDFNAGVSPVNVQASITTTIRPVFFRTSRRYRQRPTSYEYEYSSDYDYYDEVEPTRPSRPHRRRNHPRRIRVRTTSTPTTQASIPDPEMRVIQNLIAQGLLDPKDLIASDFASNITDINDDTEAIHSRRRRYAGDIDTDTYGPLADRAYFSQYVDHISNQRNHFWAEIMPILVKYEVDFSVEISVTNSPIFGLNIPTETLNIVQVEEPSNNRSRRSIDIESMEPKNHSIEIRNITRFTHEKTSYSSTYHIDYRAICFCLFALLFLIVICRFRHCQSTE